jgi:hypothetical protein
MKYDEPQLSTTEVVMLEVSAALQEPVAAPELVAEVVQLVIDATPSPEPLPASKDARCGKLEAIITEVSAELETSHAKGELQRCVRALQDALYWYERNIVVVRDAL